MLIPRIKQKYKKVKKSKKKLLPVTDKGAEHFKEL